MPDIQSELQKTLEQGKREYLSKVLNQWDEHESAIRKPPKEKEMTRPVGFNVTNNVSRETFNYVRDNPYQTRKQIIDALELRGFKSSSVDSLLVQMTRAGSLARDDEKRYAATTNEFMPIRSTYKKKTAKQRAEMGLPKPSAGIAALRPDTTPAQEPAPRKNAIIVSHNWTPQKAIENLTVFQARALYDELKKLFGG
jgi:hypothetical protein